MPKFQDLTGMVFSRLTVLERAPNSAKNEVMWHCQCSCGNKVTVRAGSLKDGNTTSCGCYHLNVISQDLTGMIFGRLTVLNQAPHSKGEGNRWRCQCQCGNTIIVRAAHLNVGTTNSCGCLRDEQLVQRSTVHGMYGTPEYNSWSSMITRCTNKNGDNYHCYGGRGIQICDRWRHSFLAFYEDMGPRPSGTTIDRIDFNGPYSPENCRWATPTEQSNNKRNNCIVEHQRASMTISQLATQVNLPYNVLYNRLKRGSNPEDAIAKPHIPLNEKTFEYRGVFMTIAQLADHFNVSYGYLYNEIKRGSDPEEIIDLCLSYRDG